MIKKDSNVYKLYNTVSIHYIYHKTYIRHMIWAKTLFFVEIREIYYFTLCE